jgi:putative membrane protein
MTQMYKSNRARFILASKGFAMGVADVIPGVSGGTIAFISGIYTHLIHSITSIKPIHAISFFQLFHPQKRALALNKLKEVEWNFLITLFAGVITAILTMARIIPFFMKEYPFYTYSLFFGLILFSIYIPYKNMKKDNLNFIILLASAIGMFLLMGPAQALTGSTNIFYVFITGAIAICAMILPVFLALIY